MSLLTFLTEEEQKTIKIITPRKTCIKCQKSLPETEFGFSSGASYRRPECRKCGNKARKEADSHKKSNPVPDDHVCPICLKSEDECRNLGGKRSGTWCHDHNHKTKAFRGHLCHRCNRLIGNSQEDVELLKRAILWIENDGYWEENKPERRQGTLAERLKAASC